VPYELKKMRENFKYVCLFLAGLVFIFSGNQARAQKHSIDSLKKLIKTGKEDTCKIDHLNLLAEQMGYYNPDTAIILSTSALQLAEQINQNQPQNSSHLRIAQSFHNIGAFYASKGDYVLSLQKYHKALDIWKVLENEARGAGKDNITKRKANTLNGLGIVYFIEGAFTKALEYYLMALRIEETFGNKKAQANNLNNIGNIYSERHEYSKAQEYYTRGLKIGELTGQKITIAISCGNLGIIYDRMNEKENALKYYFKALSIFEELKKKNRIASALGNIGTVYQSRGENELALEYYFKALKIAEELGDKGGIAIWLGNIGALYKDQKNFEKGKDYLLRSLALASEIGSLYDAKDAHERLSELYSATGDAKKAFEHFKQYAIAKDSLFNSEKEKELTRHEMNYEFEKKEVASKAEQEKKDAVTMAEKKKQRSILVLVCCVLLLVFVFAGVIFRSLRITKKQKILIEIKNKETEEQKLMIEEKNKDILDSIHYAKRIQLSLLPSEKYLLKHLTQSAKK